MKRTLLIAFGGLAALALSGCVADYGSGIYSTGYGSGYGYGYPARYYDGYYDGYYGPIYDGYWGNDGYFYYRSSARHSHYRRADRVHFSHDRRDGHGWHHWRGQLKARDGFRMPNYSHPRSDGDRDYRRTTPRFDRRTPQPGHDHYRQDRRPHRTDADRREAQPQPQRAEHRRRDRTDDRGNRARPKRDRD